MTASGITLATSSAARRSWVGSSGEKIAEMPTDFRPAAFISSAALVTAASSSGMNSRPSYSWPPSTIQTPPRTSAARSSGQSQNGGSEAEAGMPSLSAATLVRDAALHHGVDEMRGADHHAVELLQGRPRPSARRSSRRLFSESRMPVVTSSLVGALTAPEHLAVFDQDGVGVGAAHVDADASHAENTLLKSRS